MKIIVDYQHEGMFFGLNAKDIKNAEILVLYNKNECAVVSIPFMITLCDMLRNKTIRSLEFRDVSDKSPEKMYQYLTIETSRSIDTEDIIIIVSDRFTWDLPEYTNVQSTVAFDRVFHSKCEYPVSAKFKPSEFEEKAETEQNHTETEAVCTNERTTTTHNENTENPQVTIHERNAYRTTPATIQPIATAASENKPAANAIAKINASVEAVNKPEEKVKRRPVEEIPDEPITNSQEKADKVESSSAQKDSGLAKASPAAVKSSGRKYADLTYDQLMLKALINGKRIKGLNISEDKLKSWITPGNTFPVSMQKSIVKTLSLKPNYFKEPAIVEARRVLMQEAENTYKVKEIREKLNIDDPKAGALLHRGLYELNNTQLKTLIEITGISEPNFCEALFKRNAIRMAENALQKNDGLKEIKNTVPTIKDNVLHKASVLEMNTNKNTDCNDASLISDFVAYLHGLDLDNRYLYALLGKDEREGTRYISRINLGIAELTEEERQLIQAEMEGN